MSETVGNVDINSSGAGAKASKKILIKEVIPTLFVAVGGTGLEILLRLRRGLLGHNWGDHNSPHRLASLSEFPPAEFVHFDLDQGAVLERNKSANTDPFASLVTFSSSEKITESLPVDEYFADEVTLQNHPHIARWFPLSMDQIKKLPLEQGAGQIRSASRLFFFDKVDKLEKMMKDKLNRLHSAGTSQEQALKKLNISVANNARVVVICSLSGGTGSGSFLDVGWLAGQVLHEVFGNRDVHLVALLPSGFTKNNEARCKANSYAGLTELDSAMRGNLLEKYVGRWKKVDPERSLSFKPFSEVYLVDTISCAPGVSTDNVSDIYQMVADSLLEDFNNADFAVEKRSVAVNQMNSKLGDFLPPVNEGRFKDLSLSFPKLYSSFGMARIDTMERERLAQLSNKWTEEMLRAFFGVAARNEAMSIKASDANRDKFMREYLSLSAKPYGEAENDFPKISRAVDAAEGWNSLINEYQLVDHLLSVSGSNNENLEMACNKRVNEAIDDLPNAVGGDTSEIIQASRAILERLKSNLYRTAGMKNSTDEDRLERGVSELHSRIYARCQTYFYSVLDDTNAGGLDFVTSLINESTSLIENKSENIGVIAALSKARKRYENARDVAYKDFEDCLQRLQSVKKPLFGIGSSVDEMIGQIVGQVQKSLQFYGRFALRAMACERAVKLLDKLCDSMGRKIRDDENGNPIFSGFLLEIQKGRDAVEKTIDELELENISIEKQLKTEHQTLIPIEVEELEIPRPDPAVMHAWAKSAFEGQGGSKEIFQKLQDDATKTHLLATIRRVAASEITKRYIERVQVDPLFTALEDMKNNNPAELESLFTTLISRAMPWVGAGPGSSFRADRDQFKFFMGVSDASEFEKKFGSIVLRANNQPAIISFCNTGQPGRLICYSELSGFPVGAIRDLDPWFNYYNAQCIQAAKGAVAPIHNFIDSSLFTHPRVPSGRRVNSLADDFKLFQISIILGLIVRVNDRKLASGGIYQWLIEDGTWVNLISEPSIRQDGLDNFEQAKYTLEQEVKRQLKDLTGTQKLALLGLITYFKEKIYPRPLIKAGNGGQTPQNTFPHYCLLEMEDEWKKRVTSDPDFPVSDEEISDTLRLARADWNGFIRGWTEAVDGSENECYPHEVRAVNAGDDTEKSRSTGNFVPVFLPKRKVTKLFFKDPDALVDKLKDYLPSSLKPKPFEVSAPAHAQGVVGAGIAVPPPLPQLESPSYFAVIAGQQTGPFNVAQLAAMVRAGQMNQATLCWKNGLPSWLPAQSIAELNILWGAAPPPLPQV